MKHRPSPVLEKKIIEITEDSILIKEMNTFSNLVKKKKYERKNEYLIVDNNYFIKIIDVSKDSLVLANYTNSQKIVFKKLSETLKNQSKKIHLKGKTFLIEYQKKLDTLIFINDSVLVRKGIPFKNYWDLMHYKGYDILMINGYYPPLIIRDSKEGIITLTTLFTTNKPFIMTKLQ